MQIQNEIMKRSKLELLRKKTKDFFTNFQFKISFEKFGLEIKRSERRSVMQTLFREKLADIWKNLDENCQGIILLIDEAEIVEAVQGALMFLREVFSRLGEEKCSYMLVLSGKMAFPEQMTEKFSPLARFFHPLPLHNFSREESDLLLKKKLEHTDVNSTEPFLQKICEESEGHPYVLVAMAFVIFENLPERDNTITLEHYQAIKPKITTYLNTDYFGVMFRKSSPVGRLILITIAKLNGEATFSEITQSIKKSKGAISPIMPKLVEQGSIERLDRGRYKIFHSLYKEYLLTAE